MKIAFFSPFPPKRTGIAAYSDVLVHALRKRAEVSVFDDDNPELLTRDAAAFDIGAAPEVLASLRRRWDARVFSLGNNPYFHLGILRTFMREGGTLILHDTVLYFLFAGLSPGAFYKEFCLNYGAQRSAEIASLKAESPEGNLLRYPHPERYSFLRSPLERADSVIVHSNFAAHLVRGVCPEVDVRVVPLLADLSGAFAERVSRGSELRNQLGLNQDAVLIGSFGFLGRTKRLDAIARALGRVSPMLDFHFIIVGDGPDPLEPFHAAGIANRVTWLKFVSDEEYDSWLQATDIVVNLRYPSMGESSWTLARAMGFGKACLVTDSGTFAELPNGVVWKVPHDDGEESAIGTAVLTLAGNPESRTEMGARAEAYVRTVQDPETVADHFISILRDGIRTKAHRQVAATTSATGEPTRMKALINRIVEGILPAHLRIDVDRELSTAPVPRRIGLTPEDVIAAYRTLLLRDPSPETEIPANTRAFATVRQMRDAILESEEFRITRSH